MDIANVFYNTTEDGKSYMSISIDEAIKEIFPVFQNLRFAMYEIPEDRRATENSPFYRISVYKPKEKNNK